MSRKRKSVTVDREQKKKEQKGKDAADTSSSYLPEELIIENILTRLSARDLAQYSCVSKLWYDSIIKDTRFAASHFAHQKLEKEFNLNFSLTNVCVDNRQRNFFFSLQKENSHNRRNSDDEFLDLKFSTQISYRNFIEPVGSCNGLTCFKALHEPGDEATGLVTVVNLVSDGGEALHLPYHSIARTGGSGSLKYLCSGFGFDLLSKEYKVVIIFTSSTIAGDQVFISKVVTLGTNSWRDIVTSTSEITPPPDCSPFPSPLVTRAWKSSRKSGTLCGGELVWRVTNSSSNGYKADMLFSFDIHNESIHFIRLPTECSTLTPTMNDEHQYSEVGHHLLEFRGYPCVARSEKILISNRDHNHHRRRHCKHQTGFCCYRFKVDMYILKDKVKQIWAKEESFNVRIKEEELVADPFCCYFDTTTSSVPPTRVLAFSDQVLLYWFDGECLIFYSLQMKHVKVVRCSHSYYGDIFATKMEGMLAQDPRVIGEDDDIRCPYIDYQLYAQVENILPLRSLFPKGEVYEFNTDHEFQQFWGENKVPWLTRLSKKPVYTAIL